jgi:hypothetical protein
MVAGFCQFAQLANKFFEGLYKCDVERDCVGFVQKAKSIDRITYFVEIFVIMNDRNECFTFAVHSHISLCVRGFTVVVSQPVKLFCEVIEVLEGVARDINRGPVPIIKHGVLMLNQFLPWRTIQETA